MSVLAHTGQVEAHEAQVDPPVALKGGSKNPPSGYQSQVSIHRQSRWILTEKKGGQDIMMATPDQKRTFKNRVHIWAEKLDVKVAWLGLRTMRNKRASCFPPMAI